MSVYGQNLGQKVDKKGEMKLKKRTQETCFFEMSFTICEQIIIKYQIDY